MPHSFSWYTCEHIIHFTTYFIYLFHSRFMIKTVLLQLQLNHYFSCYPTYTSKTTYEPGTTTKLKNNIHIFFFLLSFFSLLFLPFVSVFCVRGEVLAMPYSITFLSILHVILDHMFAVPFFP